MLKTIQIENFLGFKKSKLIEFSFPNGKIGSGLTIFVGENNSGKSSIFEAIKKLKKDSRFLPKERHRNQNPTILFTDENDRLTKVYRTNKAIAKLEIAEGGSISVDKFEIINSRRHWQATFSTQSTNNYLQYVTNANSMDSRAGGIDTFLGSLLDQILQDNNKYQMFNDMLSRLIPSFIKWETDTDNDGRDYIKYYISTDHYHDTSTVGDGVISLFKICAHLVSTEQDLILCIDEPDLSLSPRARKILAMELAIASKTKQILVNTHCPHFVNWPDLINGAVLHRVMKDKDGECKLFKLDTKSVHFDRMTQSLEDWQKPHILDTVAKEFFFAQNIIFLEGQEDLGLIRRFIQEKGIHVNFDFFGYGAGGSANIPSLLQLSKELGIKAGALFDKNAPGLEKIDINSFKVVELPFDDIRIKKERPSLTGLFNENGTISQKNEQILNEIIQEFVEYFK